MDNELNKVSAPQNNEPASAGPKMISLEEVMKVSGTEERQPQQPQPTATVAVTTPPTAKPPSAPKVISLEEVTKVSGTEDRKATYAPTTTPETTPTTAPNAPKTISLEEVTMVSGTEDRMPSNNPPTIKMETTPPQQQAQTVSLDEVSKVSGTEDRAPQQQTTTPVTISAEAVKKESVKAEKSKKEQKKEAKELKKSIKKKKKRLKPNFINFLLILVIFLSLTFIITPPTLRKLMPKIDITKPSKLENTKILSCSAINIQEKYKIVSRTKYVSDETIQNIITYTKIEDSKLESEKQNNTLTNISPSEEVNKFSRIRGILIDNKNSSTIVTIYDYVAKKNTNNPSFIKYFQAKDKQQAFYTGMGYTCEELDANE